jgi:iron(III) transport system ATP-binding protein
MEAPARDNIESRPVRMVDAALEAGRPTRQMISVTGLVKKYGEQVAVAGVDLEIPEGEFFTLLGPSGCGKTTTLRCIAGLETPDAGEIRLGDEVVARAGHSVPTYRRNIGMVFQNYAVWPHMTVYDNVAFPLRAGARRRAPEPEVRTKVTQALATVGLEGLDKRMATQLSGGQQQRLSLARAIVREPKVLLLDEPLSNLDSRLRQRMRVELALIQRQLAVTTLFVTHDQIEALSMSDRVAVMREGRIVQQGAPREIYHEPASAFVARFIGSTNLVEGRVASYDRQTETLRLVTDLGEVSVDGERAIPVGDVVDIAVRPEDIKVQGTGEGPSKGQARNIFQGRVVIAQFIGGSVDALVDSQGTQIRLVVGSRTRWREGETVRFELPPDLCRVLQRSDHPSTPART